MWMQGQEVPSIPTLEEQGGIENSWADLKQRGEVKDLCGEQVLFWVTDWLEVAPS